MKKTGKRVIAVVLCVVMTLSMYTVGAVAIVSLLNSNSVLTDNASNIINADSVEEAIEIMQNTPGFFAGDESTGNVLSDSADLDYAAPQSETVYPTVIIPGISQSISYLADEDGYVMYNANGEELSGGLLILDTSTLPTAIANNLVAPLMRSLVTQSDKDESLRAACSKTVGEVFSIQASNTDGEPVNNLQLVSYMSSVADMSQDDRDYFYRMIPMQTLTEDTVDVTTGEVVQEAVLSDDDLYLYTFPLISDPMESAEGLDEYIQFVKEDSGMDKVNIVTISLGGTILTAYLELFKGTGYPDLNRIVNVVSCLQGTDVMGDFYLRDFRIGDEEGNKFFFSEFLPMIMMEMNDSATLGYIINIALKIMPQEVVYSILSGAVDGIIDTLMINCPQFWAMIPADRFDDVKAKYNFIWDTEHEEYGNQVLANKIDAFHTASVNLVDNLKAFADTDNRLVHSVAGYDLDYSSQDYCFFAAMSSSETTNSDAIIDIDSTTLGATYAKAGSILEDDILFAEGSRVSPDGSIDISTCAFPDNVWLFHGQHHEVGRNDVVIALIGQLITGNIKSVNDDKANFPQFNGNRNTRNIRRWCLDDAEVLITNYADGQTVNPQGETIACREADIDELKNAYQEALYLLTDTICEPTAADAATQRIEDAIYRAGHNGQLPVEDTTTDDVIEVICMTLDDIITTIFGPSYGFSEYVEHGVTQK